MDPDWTATSNLSIRTAAGATGTVVMTCRPVHRGKRSVFMEAQLADEDTGPLGIATISFARITRVSNITDEAGAPDGTVTDFGVAEREESRGLADYLGVRTIPLPPGAAAVEIDFGERVRNSTGSLQGGALAALLEEAALRLASSLLSDSVRLADLELHYLAGGRVGPFRAIATPIRVADAHLACRIELTDEGADGRLLAVATGTVLA
jgi:uncharacterized protein (TIGR00369 family)